MESDHVEGVLMVGWDHTLTPHPTNSEAHPFQSMQTTSAWQFPLPCFLHRSHLLAEDVGLEHWQTGSCWHGPMRQSGIRAQLSGRRSLRWLSAAMQAGSGSAGGTELCCFCFSWSVCLSVCLPPSQCLLLFSLKSGFLSSSVSDSLSWQCSAVRLQDCSWHCWV